MKVLADVGMLGLPNAGKSTFITAVSAAKPKVADYPFTTLNPSLGVVQVQRHRSFVVADIPGLIEGAADGAGLGIRFLKHLTRCRILVHLVDICPIDGSDPAENAVSIVRELENFSPTLSKRERWLVLNKLDLLSEEEAQERQEKIVAALNWQGPVYRVSAIAQQGTKELCEQLLSRLEDCWELERQDPEAADAELDLQLQMQAEAREKIESLSARRKAKNDADDEENDDDDDFDVEVEYAH